MSHCTFLECTEPHYALGLCNKHWLRTRKHGTPAGSDRNHATADVRFWRGVQRGADNDCWLYVRGPRRGRYGRFQPGAKGSPSVLAHRFSYQLAHGDIPAGMVVMHRCDTPRCVNPQHLRVGTPKQNTADMIAKGRHARIAPVGSDNGRAVLTADDVRAIRASSETNRSIAERLGVGINTVRSVRIKRTWAHIPD